MQNPVPGSLLISPPGMADSRFNKTVMLITHHQDRTGSHAVCINRPTDKTAVEIGKDLKITGSLPYTMHWGGPIQQSSIWMLHTPEWSIEESMKVTDELFLTSNEKMFHHLADGDTPRDFLIAFGFASWAPMQLRMELEGVPPFTRKSSWLILQNPEQEWLFRTPSKDLWESALFKTGEQAVNTWLP